MAEASHRSTSPCDFLSYPANHGVSRGEWTFMTARQQQQRFEALLDEHRGIVFKVAGLYSRRAADREDLVQEICMRSSASSIR